jgi:transcriptional regulator with XRE-family HTH domain
MKKLQVGEWAQKIYDLRINELDLSQEKFADELGVSQGTVSSWEKGEKEYAPSAAAYFLIGTLAAKRGKDPAWFWKQAGADMRTLESIIEERLKARGRAALPGEVIEVPLLSTRELIENGEARERKTFRLLSDHVLSRASTVALRIEADAIGRVFGAGDTLVVDTCTTDLSSLWDKVTLVHLDPSQSPHPSGWLTGRWGRGGLHMGLLQLAPPRGVGPYSFRADLGPLGTAEHEPLPIGSWRNLEAEKIFEEKKAERETVRRQAERAETEKIRRSSGDPDWRGLSDSERQRVLKAGEAAIAKFGPPLKQEELRRALELEARTKCRPAPGCRVLGRMVAWFSAEHERDQEKK